MAQWWGKNERKMTWKQSETGPCGDEENARRSATGHTEWKYAREDARVQQVQQDAFNVNFIFIAFYGFIQSRLFNVQGFYLSLCVKSMKSLN